MGMVLEKVDSIVHSACYQHSMGMVLEKVDSIVHSGWYRHSMGMVLEKVDSIVHSACYQHSMGVVLEKVDSIVHSGWYQPHTFWGPMCTVFKGRWVHNYMHVSEGDNCVLYFLSQQKPIAVCFSWELFEQCLLRLSVGWSISCFKSLSEALTSTEVTGELKDKHSCIFRFKVLNTGYLGTCWNCYYWIHTFTCFPRFTNRVRFIDIVRQALEINIMIISVCLKIRHQFYPSHFYEIMTFFIFSPPLLFRVIEDHMIDLVINLPNQKTRHPQDNYLIRRAAVDCAVPLITNFEVSRLWFFHLISSQILFWQQNSACS